MEVRRDAGVLTLSFDERVTEREIGHARQVPGEADRELILDFHRAREVTNLALGALVAWAGELDRPVRTRGLRQADHVALGWLTGRRHGAGDGEEL